MATRQDGHVDVRLAMLGVSIRAAVSAAASRQTAAATASALLRTALADGGSSHLDWLAPEECDAVLQSAAARRPIEDKLGEPLSQHGVGGACGLAAPVGFRCERPPSRKAQGQPRPSWQAPSWSAV